MILLRLISRTWKALSAPLPVRLPGPRALPSYAQMGRYIAAGVALDPRVDLLVRQLAAELAGCRWCIEYGLHRWRQAFLPIGELAALRYYAASPLFSPRERAALALTEAVAGEHFFNPATGALGADARLGPAGPAAGGSALGARRAARSGVRNLW